MNDKCCRTCKYHDDFTWACFNGDSVRKGDYTHADHYVCDEWEEVDEQSDV